MKAVKSTLGHDPSLRLAVLNACRFSHQFGGGHDLFDWGRDRSAQVRRM